MSAPGPVLPRYRWGHCSYDPAVSGRICGAPAITHLWIEDSPPWTTYACEDHAPAARWLLDPLDWHQVSGECVDSHARWHPTGAPGESFCALPEDLEAQAEATEPRQLTGATP